MGYRKRRSDLLLSDTNFAFLFLMQATVQKREKAELSKHIDSVSRKRLKLSHSQCNVKAIVHFTRSNFVIYPTAYDKQAMEFGKSIRGTNALQR